MGAEQGDSVKIAEPLDGPIMQRYCELARESKIWLSLGGFQEKGSDDSHLRNTHVIVDDAGNIRSKYSKIHLFDVDVPGGMVYKERSFTEPAVQAEEKPKKGFDWTTNENEQITLERFFDSTPTTRLA